jgi:hypothetical protein
MMSAVLPVLSFAFWNEFGSFGHLVAYVFAALLVMQGGYFAGILVRSAPPLAKRATTQTGTKHKKANADPLKPDDATVESARGGPQLP